jgi:hypothetical protein
MPTMPKTLNPDKMKYNYQNHREEYVAELRESLDRGFLKPEDFSVRDCFINLIEGGQELFNLINQTKRGGAAIRDVMEAAGDSINSGDFANITGQFVFNKTREGYNYPTALWPSLVETYQTDFLDGERIPGVGEFGYSSIEVVGEGEKFPEIGLNEEYTDTVPLQKRGFVASVTKEMILKDRTGLLLMRAANGGKWMGIQKDIRCIQLATGTGSAANNYNRNGVSTNTYLSTGSYINQANVILLNWQSVQTLELLFAAITDPNTSAPIVVECKQLLMPLSLLRSAEFIRHALSVGLVDNTASSNTVRTYADNPLNKGFYGGAGYEILSNAFVSNVTGSQIAWFLGDFKKALWYKEAWGMEETQAPPDNPESFWRDVMMAWKISECGAGQAIEPRYIARAN